MDISFVEIIDFFWINFRKAKSYEDYLYLLENIEYKCIELYKQIDKLNQNDPIKQQMPLLAMISEIQLVCPKAVEHMAEKSEIIKKAASFLERYSPQKRQLLKKYFLNSDANS